MYKILIAVLLCLVLLCGCASTSQPEVADEELASISSKLDKICELLSKNPGAVVDTDSDNVTIDDSDVNIDDVDQPVDTDTDTDSDSGSSSNSSDSSSTTKSPSANKMPTTTKEIVEYYSKSANQVKVDKPGFTCTDIPAVGEIKCDGLQSLVNSIKSAAMKTVKPTTIEAKKGQDHTKFSVVGETWGSKLDPNFVKKATCTKSGNFYNIHIELKDEKLSELPLNHDDCQTGKGISILTGKQMNEALSNIPILKVTRFASHFTGCYIDAKINISTGKMVETTNCMNVIADIEANSILSGQVPFSIKKVYKINY